MSIKPGPKSFDKFQILDERDNGNCEQFEIPNLPQVEVCDTKQKLTQVNIMFEKKQPTVSVTFDKEMGDELKVIVMPNQLIETCNHLQSQINFMAKDMNNIINTYENLKQDNDSLKREVSVITGGLIVVAIIKTMKFIFARK
jgi:hypothetical protein